MAEDPLPLSVDRYHMLLVHSVRKMRVFGIFCKHNLTSLDPDGELLSNLLKVTYGPKPLTRYGAAFIVQRDESSQRGALDVAKL